MLLRDLVLVFVGTGFGIVLRDLCAPLLASLRRPPTLPQPVNMFRGTVFPAPHDPRWQLVAANCPGGIYFFGDRDISVSRGGLLVGDVIISADTKVAEYHAAIERAQAERAAEEALVCVEPAILGAGYLPESAVCQIQVPLFIDGHPMPAVDDEAWKPGHNESLFISKNGHHMSVFISKNGHHMSVFPDGDVYLDSAQWFKHKDVVPYYRTVFARVGETKDQAGAELARR